VWHGDKGRKKTGGKINLHRKKRKFELGSQPAHTILGKERKKFSKRKFGRMKMVSIAADVANVYNPKTKRTEKTKILDIESNPANPHFVRRKVITKGSVIKTELGMAVVTSRPSQVGIVSAVLTAEKK